jgi:hypothetical protein
MGWPPGAHNGNGFRGKAKKGEIPAAGREMRIFPLWFCAYQQNGWIFVLPLAIKFPKNTNQPPTQPAAAVKAGAEAEYILERRKSCWKSTHPYIGVERQN